MKKRIMCFLLALLMVISILPPQTFAVDATSEKECNCPEGHDVANGHVATCPLYTCPLCGKADCYDGVNCQPETEPEKHPMVDKNATVKSSFSGYAYWEPGSFMSGISCDAYAFPELMIITAVETVNGVDYYQLSAVKGEWKYGLGDGIWMKAEYMDVQLPEEPDAPTNPSQPDDSITGTIRDVTVSVQGNLPAGVKLQLNAVAAPNIDGDSVYAYDVNLEINGEKVQPDAPVKVTFENVTLYPDGVVCVYHVLDTVAAIQSRLGASNVGAIPSTEFGLNGSAAEQAALAATGEAGVVYVEYFSSEDGTVSLGAGTVTITVNSFSPFYIVSGDTTKVSVEKNIINADDGMSKDIYVMPGTTIKFNRNRPYVHWRWNSTASGVTATNNDGDKVGTGWLQDNWGELTSKDEYCIVTIASTASVGSTATLETTRGMNKSNSVKITIHVVSKQEIVSGVMTNTTYPVFLACLQDSTVIPGEPGVTSAGFYFLNSSYAPQGDFPHFAPSGNGVIASSIGSNPNFKASADGTNTMGLVDTTGKTTKAAASGINWDSALRGLVNAGSSVKASDGVTVTSANVEYYEMLPYVIKLQTTTSLGWHIDCMVVPKNTATLSYSLNLPGGNTVSGIAVPAGVNKPTPFSVTVGAVSVNGTNLTLGSKVKTTAGREFTFEGWYTNASGTGNRVEIGSNLQITENLILYAKWSGGGYTIGTLIVGKVVKTAANSETPNANDQFTFSINLSGNYSYKIYDATTYSEISSGTMTNGTFTLKGNQAIYIANVPVGDYTVTEKSIPSNYTASAAKQTVTVAGGVENIVTFTNTYNKPLTYTITWKNDDGSVIGTTTVKHGDTPSHADASKASTAEYTYTFAGWTPTVVAATGDKTYTATYHATPNHYTITWKNGAEVIKTEQLAYGAAVTAPADPTKTGHSFGGWDITVPATMPARNVTINAKWTVNQYTISFNSDGGSTVDSVKYNYGADVDKLSVPTKENHEFLGWAVAGGSNFTDKNGNVLDTAYTMPANDIQLVAQWKLLAAQYKVETYVMGIDGNYDRESSVTSSALIGSTVETTPEAREGFTVAADSVLSVVVAADGSATLKVYYSRNRYTVTYKVDGKVDGTVNTVYYGSKVEVRAEPSKAGYTFSGWKIGNEEAEDFNMPVGNVTIEGTFTANTNTQYKVETYMQELDGTYTKSTETKYGTTDTLAQIVPAAPTGFEYKAAGSVLSGNINGDGTLVLKVYYDRQTYTVTWNVDGSNTTADYKFGATIVKSANPEKQGYNFAGWLGYTNNMTMPAHNVTFTATWTPRTDTPYVVKHLQQNVTGDGYTVVETLNLTGTTDTQVTPAVNSYTGFVSPSKVTITISADGKTVLEYKYDRIEYTVTYKVDGNTVHTETVRYQGNVTNVPQIPVKEGYNQTAPIWSHNGQNITQNTVINAQYTINKYTITATMENGSVSGKANAYNHGAAANVTFTPNTGYKITGVTVNGVAQTDFTESSYVYSKAAMDGDVEIVVATTLKSYTVKFVNEDGTVLQSSEVPHGDLPVYTAATPIKAATAQYSYTFADWTPVIEAATGDKTYTATYTKSTNTYNITWVDGDGNTLATITMAYGTTPTYNGTTPTKAATAQYTYTFNNTWSPVIKTVTGDATYTAQFDSTVNKYMVRWENEDGSELEVDANVPYGTMPTYNGALPTKAANAQYTYTHNGWTPTVSEVTGDVTYVATYSATANKYTVTWIVDGKVTEETYEYGQIPSFKGSTNKPADAQYTYTFAGWDKDLAEVTGNATYTAQYDTTANTYTVTWVDEDGTVLETDKNVPYGSAVEFNGEEPKKEHDKDYYYVFAGWTPAIQNYMVTGDVTFKAQYNPVLERYDVLWYNADETLLYTSEQVLYGKEPVYGGQNPPSYNPNDGYTYTFKGWSPVVSPVFGAASYKAKYTRVRNDYTIGYNLFGGVVEGNNPVVYNVESDAITLINPTKEGHTFAGWTGTDLQGPTMTVTIPKGSIGNRTYNATWMVIEYNISYNLNGGTVEGQNPVKYEAETDTFTLINPAKEGYTFDGWTGTGLVGKTMTVTIEKGSIGNREYTANWTANTYKIHFDGNGSTGGTMDDLAMTYDASKNLTANIFVRTGYHFIGWKDNQGKTYANQAEVKNLVVEKNGSITLYAQWKINTVSLTITTNNPIDYNQSYIFTVKGKAVDGREIELTVAVGANDLQKIVNLPAGTYTISDQPEWSWRYAGQTITHDVHADAVVDFNYTYNQQAQVYWLNGYGNDKLKDDPKRRKK